MAFIYCKSGDFDKRGEKKDFGFAKNGQLQLSRQGYSQSSAYACT